MGAPTWNSATARGVHTWYTGYLRQAEETPRTTSHLAVFHVAAAVSSAPSPAEFRADDGTRLCTTKLWFHPFLLPGNVYYLIVYLCRGTVVLLIVH
jgi:hypothetical protein